MTPERIAELRASSFSGGAGAHALTEALDAVERLTVERDDREGFMRHLFRFTVVTQGPLGPDSWSDEIRSIGRRNGDYPYTAADVERWRALWAETGSTVAGWPAEGE
jgi:hypothetical protein